VLFDDGRRTFSSIASELGVSVGTVRNRFSKLIEQRVLHIYGRANPNNVGFQTYARIEIAVEPASEVAIVARQIAELKEVSFLASISGDLDLEVNVMCRDNNHLEKLVTHYLQTIEGIREIRTTFYLRVLKLAQPALSLLSAHDAAIHQLEEHYDLAGGKT